MLDATPGRQHVVRRHAPHDAQIPAERLANGATPPIHLAVNALHTPARQRCIADIAPDTPDEPTRTPRRPNDSPMVRHCDDPSRCVRSEHARMLAHAFTNFSLSLSRFLSLYTDISIGSSVFARLTIVTNRHTLMQTTLRQGIGSNWPNFAMLRCSQIVADPRDSLGSYTNPLAFPTTVEFHVILQKYRFRFFRNKSL